LHVLHRLRRAPHQPPAQQVLILSNGSVWLNTENRPQPCKILTVSSRCPDTPSHAFAGYDEASNPPHELHEPFTFAQLMADHDNLSPTQSNLPLL
jgi:hypothetical protein